MNQLSFAINPLDGAKIYELESHTHCHQINTPSPPVSVIMTFVHRNYSYGGTIKGGQKDVLVALYTSALYTWVICFG